MKKIDLKGLIAAAYTPMDSDGGLALGRVPEVVDTVLARGITGFYVCGSTGEWSSLSTAERKLVAEAYVQAVDGRVPVVIQVGGFNVHSACELAAHAEGIGADAISASAPSYFPSNCADTVMTCMQRIAASGGGVPFYYYYIPALSATAMDADEFLNRALDTIPSLAGIKYSGSQLFEYMRLVERAGDDLDVFFGSDELYLQGVASGAKGAIGSTYNYLAPLYLAVRRAFEAGDHAQARQLQGLAVRMVLRIVKGPQPHAGLKAAMKLSGSDCGQVRLPQRPMPAAEIDALGADLERMGFVEWASPKVEV